jgi:hypothetical protein
MWNYRWGGPDSTPPDAVARAAATLGVLREVIDDGEVDGRGPVPLILVEAHGSLWLIYPDPRSVFGVDR